MTEGPQRGVRLTLHARTAMARRQISERDVRAVLASPQVVLPGNRAGRQIVQGLATIGDPPQKVLLRVVLDSGQSPPAVVTVYATTQFERYGVEP